MFCFSKCKTELKATNFDNLSLNDFFYIIKTVKNSTNVYPFLYAITMSSVKRDTSFSIKMWLLLENSFTFTNLDSCQIIIIVLRLAKRSNYLHCFLIFMRDKGPRPSFHFLTCRFRKIFISLFFWVKCPFWVVLHNWHILLHGRVEERSIKKIIANFVKDSFSLPFFVFFTKKIMGECAISSKEIKFKSLLTLKDIKFKQYKYIERF